MASSADGDQAKVIEELKAKLAASEAKTKDFGKHCIFCFCKDEC